VAERIGADRVPVWRMRAAPAAGRRVQGWISPVLAVDGRIAGVWTGERHGDTLTVTIEAFGPLAGPVRTALADAATAVARAGGTGGATVLVDGERPV
jgi:DNA glycosylase AlkZ-like